MLIYCTHNFKYVPNTLKNNGVKLFTMYLELNYKKSLNKDYIPLLSVFLLKTKLLNGCYKKTYF